MTITISCAFRQSRSVILFIAFNKTCSGICRGKHMDRNGRDGAVHPVLCGPPYASLYSKLRGVVVGVLAQFSLHLRRVSQRSPYGVTQWLKFRESQRGYHFPILSSWSFVLFFVYYTINSTAPQHICRNILFDFHVFEETAPTLSTITNFIQWFMC